MVFGIPGKSQYLGFQWIKFTETVIQSQAIKYVFYEKQFSVEEMEFRAKEMECVVKEMKCVTKEMNGEIQEMKVN